MISPRWFLLPLCLGAAAIACLAQPNRITSRIDPAQTVVLAGRVHPLANPANDAGPVESSFPLFLTLSLKPSTDQQSALTQLTQQQQDPSSSSFHKWLTPEQYADSFGASAADVAQITAWLQGQGFTLYPASRSRTFVMFGGASGQVQKAFGATIHRFVVNGVSHYANINNPTIPAALSSLVSGIRGLHDFHLRPQYRTATQPQAILNGQHVLAPADFAAIYDINPLYTAGINGSGQSIVIVGQSALYKSGSDITTFWNLYNITGATLTQTLVPGSGNPGVSQGDLDESTLDIEWSSAVARNANIVFVYSTDVLTSATYAVDQNLAPVLSMSYGGCEQEDLTDLPGQRQQVQQANAQGITWLAASGDQGAAACDDFPANPISVAEGGLAVNVPAAIPEVTAMGGTMLNDTAGSYWNSSGTATGYIPEQTWNESIVAGQLSAGGGGASVYFPQPAWQSNMAPNDGWRHVPDLSFNAAAYHDPYYMYCFGCQASSRGVEPIGGTSVATPTMAGVVALLNQYAVSNGLQSKAGLGNINPTLYRLSQSAPSAFHDITTGNNIVACAYASPGCSNGSEGYTAVVGYDSANGLGSVDVTNLVHLWSNSVATAAVVVPSINQNPVFETSGGQWNFQLTLSEEAGVAATLTGLTINGVDHSSQIKSLFGSGAIPARQSISGSTSLSLASVPANETFGFSGTDAAGNHWSTSLTIPFQGPLAPLTIAGASNAASGQQVFAPGMIMSVYGAGLGTLAQAAATIPLPPFMAGLQAYICAGACRSDYSNANQSYLYYVGPNQVNLQIPYEITPGTAELDINTAYVPDAPVIYRFTVASAGPGIFMFPDGSVNPSRTASVGSTVPMFITGEGQVSPSLEDGYTPAASTPLSRLPKPVQSVTVTVGGITAATTFVGIPNGLVGVTQINFTIPAGVASGRQPVIVTVGGTASPAAYITIQ